MSDPPQFVALMDRIACLPTNGVAERSALLAAVRWVNTQGELWPALANWARVAGLTPRGLQRVLRRLEQCGIIQSGDGSTGGARRTTRYRIPALIGNPDPWSGLEPRPARHGTPTPEPSNPDRRAPKPRPPVTQSTREQPGEQPTTGAGVVAGLSAELREHPNATPERLALIEREAPTKTNPGGWAAECIRKGWAVPEPSAADRKARSQAAREALLAEFARMPETQRAAIRVRVRKTYPNLERFPDDDPGVLGGVVRVLQAQRDAEAQAGSEGNTHPRIGGVAGGGRGVDCG